jgi:hypothetical protein
LTNAGWPAQPGFESDAQNEMLGPLISAGHALIETHQAQRLFGTKNCNYLLNSGTPDGATQAAFKTRPAPYNKGSEGAAPMDDANKRTVDVTPLISPEEAERRRTHARIAIAENRLEGIATSPEAQAVIDAYIRGEIEVGDLVKAYKEGRYRKGPPLG